MIPTLVVAVVLLAYLGSVVGRDRAAEREIAQKLRAAGFEERPGEWVRPGEPPVHLAAEPNDGWMVLIPFPGSTTVNLEPGPDGFRFVGDLSRLDSSTREVLAKVIGEPDLETRHGFVLDRLGQELPKVEVIDRSIQLLKDAIAALTPTRFCDTRPEAVHWLELAMAEPQPIAERAARHLTSPDAGRQVLEAASDAAVRIEAARAVGPVTRALVDAAVARDPAAWPAAAAWYCRHAREDLSDLILESKAPWTAWTRGLERAGLPHDLDLWLLSAAGLACSAHIEGWISAPAMCRLLRDMLAEPDAHEDIEETGWKRFQVNQDAVSRALRDHGGHDGGQLTVSDEAGRLTEARGGDLSVVE